MHPRAIPEFLKNALVHTIYGEVTKAMNDAGRAKSVIKRFTEQRKLAFAILGGIVAFYVARGQLTAAADIVVFILLCSQISMTYDGINENTYKAYVEAIGPVMFTLVNILPIIVSQTLLCIELVATYGSKPAAVIVILLAALPGFLQVIAGSLMSQEATLPDA